MALFLVSDARSLGHSTRLGGCSDDDAGAADMRSDMLRRRDCRGAGTSLLLVAGGADERAGLLGTSRFEYV